MHKQWLCCALALASWAAAGVLGGVAAETLTSDKVGCFAVVDVERLDRVIKAAGPDAFVALADKMQAAGQCVPLRAGKRIVVEDAAANFICLRTAPGLPCAWTWRATLQN